MVETSELAAILEELQMLRNLYRKIADQNVGDEDPMPGDFEAVDSGDEYYELSEVKKLLKSRKE